MHSSKYRVIVFAIVIILVILGVLYYAGNQSTDTTEDTSAPLLVGDNAIYVPDALPGTAVNVGFATLAADGFVVIHEDSNGTPGAIIGTSALLSQGTHNSVAVSLTRASVEGETLYAMLHRDNGDATFNPADDAPLQDGQSSPVYMIFHASNNADESGPDAVSL